MVGYGVFWLFLFLFLFFLVLYIYTIGYVLYSIYMVHRAMDGSLFGLFLSTFERVICSYSVNSRDPVE